MNDNVPFLDDDQEQIVVSKYFQKNNLATPTQVVIPESGSSNELKKGRANAQGERWTDDRINEELLREVSESPASAKNSYRNEENEETACAPERSTSLQDTSSKFSSSRKHQPDQFVAVVPSAVANAFTVSAAISQTKRDGTKSYSVPFGGITDNSAPSLTDNGGPGRRKALSPPSSPPPSKKVKSTTSDQQTRGRMASLEKKEKPKDWTKAAEKPPGLEKGEKDICLTCINYGRQCKGTSLVQVTRQDGKQEIKCSACASKSGHGGRRCYWKESARNINTYEEARTAYGGIVNTKNSRAGRIERAKRDPNSRLALDPNRTYIPPSPATRRSSNYQSARILSGVVEVSASVPQATTPVFLADRQIPSSLTCDREASNPVIIENDQVRSIPVFNRELGTPTLSDDLDVEGESQIDDDDIKNAFKDVKAEVTSILRAHLDDKWTARELYTSMLVFVTSLDARDDLRAAVAGKVMLLRDGAIAQEWLDEE